jgi:hypothetical protein
MQDAEGGRSSQGKHRSSRRKHSSNFENLEGSFSPSNFQPNDECNKLKKWGITFCDQTDFKHFVEEDLKNSTWVEKEIKKPMHAEEISVEIGLAILNELLSETSEICSNFIN